MNKIPFYYNSKFYVQCYDDLLSIKATFNRLSVSKPISISIYPAPFPIFLRYVYALQITLISLGSITKQIRETLYHQLDGDLAGLLRRLIAIEMRRHRKKKIPRAIVTSDSFSGPLILGCNRFASLRKLSSIEIPFRMIRRDDRGICRLENFLFETEIE